MRIYVACLAAYNSGFLHGRWIEATPFVEDMEEEVREMLAASPEEGAEEWAIHDHEGFPNGTVGEFTPLSEIARLAEIAEAAEEEGFDPDVLMEAMRDAGAEDENPARWLGDNFYRTVEAWDEDAAWEEVAYEMAEDCGSAKELPEWVRNYVDWKAMGRDMRLNGDFRVYEGNPGTFHFFNA